MNDLIRQTMLFIPGNNPSMVQNGLVFNSDSIIFDLEDAVSINQKDTARILITNALKNINYEGVEIVVRVNSLDSNLTEKDINYIVHPQLDTVLLPKTNKAEDIKKIDNILSRVEDKKNIDKNIKIMALIETALGLENVFEITKASERLIGVLFGGEDYTADIRAERTEEGEEIDYPRSRILVACRAAEIAAIDTPYSDIENLEGLKEDTRKVKALGFDGKAVISPRHIGVVNKIFSPSEKEIYWAKRVIRAIERAESEGKGVISLDGKMIDAPIVNRAKRIIKIAEEKEGVLS